MSGSGSGEAEAVSKIRGSAVVLRAVDASLNR